MDQNTLELLLKVNFQHSDARRRKQGYIFMAPLSQGAESHHVTWPCHATWVCLLSVRQCSQHCIIKSLSFTLSRTVQIHLLLNFCNIYWKREYNKNRKKNLSGSLLDFVVNTTLIAVA